MVFHVFAVAFLQNRRRLTGEFYLSARKYTIPERGMSISKSFIDNVDHLTLTARRDGKVASIDTFAYNTKTYYGAIRSAIRNNNASIDIFRLLLYKGDKYDDSELRNNIVRWHRLREDRKINNLEIQFYDFEPSIYFSIYCKNFLHWGFFKRTESYLDPFDTSVDYGVLGHDKVGESLISELAEYFNNVWDKHSHKDETFIKECIESKNPS